LAKKKVIPVRLSENLYTLIGDYASFLDISKSEALREIIKEGLLRKSYVGLTIRWQKQASKRDPMIEMIECEKCSNNQNLKLYHIDGNIRNLNPENLVILCEKCIADLHKFMRDYNPKEKFAAWFFYS